MASKYRNEPFTVYGIRFDSIAEAHRYLVLKSREEAGEISNLELQPRYPLVVYGVKVGTYVADFRYNEGVRVIVEDVKGVRTEVYKLKRKLMLACYGIEIQEVGA